MISPIHSSCFLSKKCFLRRSTLVMKSSDFLPKPLSNVPKSSLNIAIEYLTECNCGMTNLKSIFFLFIDWSGQRTWPITHSCTKNGSHSFPDCCLNFIFLPKSCLKFDSGYKKHVFSANETGMMNGSCMNMYCMSLPRLLIEYFLYVNDFGLSETTTSRSMSERPGYEMLPP